MAYIGDSYSRREEEGQKNVITFIIGLLIGCLLIWVFSTPTPESYNNSAVAELAQQCQEVGGNYSVINNRAVCTTEVEIFNNSI